MQQTFIKHPVYCACIKQHSPSVADYLVGVGSAQKRARIMTKQTTGSSSTLKSRTHNKQHLPSVAEYLEMSVPPRNEPVSVQLEAGGFAEPSTLTN